MATYDRVRDLPVEIESYRLEPLQVQASHDFTRLTTVIHLEGGGHEGVGEDVTYSSEDQQALQAEGPTLPLAGSFTLDDFSALLDGLELFLPGLRQTIQRAEVRRQDRLITLDQANRRVIGPAHPSRPPGNRIKHRLQFRRRAGDDAEDFTRGSLLLQRLLQFLEQSNVLDRNHCLIRKSFEELDLRRGERTYLGTTSE